VFTAECGTCGGLYLRATVIGPLGGPAIQGAVGLCLNSCRSFYADASGAFHGTLNGAAGLIDFTAIGS